MFDGVFRADLMLSAAALNLVYIGLTGVYFLYTFRQARIRGLLLNIGE